MAKCWTCGTHVSGYHYTCSSCQSLAELKSLQKKVASYGRDIYKHLDYIYIAQVKLKDTLSTGLSEIASALSEIASAIEWGFGEISWQLQQQTDVLRSIDYTLKTPSETKANEWRLHAEELRRRGVLEESEELFLKALNEYRLDYRIYVGLAETYLQMNKFDKARAFLEKSLPHAPKKEIDYKSYSYRLIGHIYACEEDYNQATSILRSSIELSPSYEDGHYDYAQYSAQTSNKEACLSSLQKAILIKPLYFYLSQKEKNFNPFRHDIQNLLITTALTRTLTSDYYDGIFELAKYCAQTKNLETCISLLRKLIFSKPDYFYRAQKEKIFGPVRGEVSKLLSSISTEALSRAKDAIDKAEGALLNEARDAVSEARRALSVSRDKTTLDSITMYEKAEAKLKLAKDKVASGDYVAFLEAKPIAEESYTIANNSLNTAEGERKHYIKRRGEKVKNAWKRVPGAFIGWPLLFAIIGAIGDCTVGIFIPGKGTTDAGASAGSLIGIVIGLIFGIYNIQKELQ